LSPDISSRWNSTYKMFRTILMYEYAFTMSDNRDPYYNVDLVKDDDIGGPPILMIGNKLNTC